MQADMNLAKITTSYSQVLNTQNANMKIPNMILIVYLNENFTNCNENLGWGKSEHPHSSLCILVQVKAPEVSQIFILHSFHVAIINF